MDFLGLDVRCDTPLEFNIDTQNDDLENVYVCNIGHLFFCLCIPCFRMLFWSLFVGCGPQKQWQLN